MVRRLAGSFLLLLLGFTAIAQPAYSPEAVREIIAEFRAYDRGPYKSINWFCDDGSIIGPKEDCPGEGVQHASYSDKTKALQARNHLFFGQILANTPKEAFWDVNNNYSRAKQYQLGKFLQAADNGWVLERGQYYRGAFQAEDEEEWGVDFFKWLLKEERRLDQHWFLLRQLAKVIPHAGDTDNAQEVRAVSKAIAEEYPKFMDLRIKIHGQPEPENLVETIAFNKEHRSRMDEAERVQMDRLIEAMQELYQPVNMRSLEAYTFQLPDGSEPLLRVNHLLASPAVGPARAIQIAETLQWLRAHHGTLNGPFARLALLDLSNALERILLRDMSDWQPETPTDLGEKNCYLAMAAAGTGLIELWEWEAVEGDFSIVKPMSTLADLRESLSAAQRTVEWGTGTTRSVYQDIVNQYAEFEPKALGFYDDMIRSSVLLPLGDGANRMGEVVAEAAGLQNAVLDLRKQTNIRGINPGYAKGELVVVDGDPDAVEVDNEKIYIFERPPDDLKPLAGIATVTEGNMVSHVQLLARNLGIPNAVISPENLNELKRYAGQEIFYAVSNGGTVIMKPVSQLTENEKALFAKRERNSDKVRVPTDKIDLDQRAVINMRDVDNTASGILVGPKAANLGELKKHFPEQVVEGIILPFGIFRQHMDQAMPGTGGSFWDFLNATFAEAKSREAEGDDRRNVDRYVMGRLDELRAAIEKMPLLPEFEDDLRASFAGAFGKPLGEVPIFIRSDTNMEDLAEFTGAGLNLTLFNVRDQQKILDGIKKVWASPYTERSYKWRQRYLINPENVFPSILIIPSVNVDKSGVLITKGVSSGRLADQTVAFSRGVGGAVDGQSAETYLIRAEGDDVLLSPAREYRYRTIPPSGGSTVLSTTFEERVLTEADLRALRTLAYDAHTKLAAAPNIPTDGPLDIELGFKDSKIWLFQVRPFVENKNALTSNYLESISPVIDDEQAVFTNDRLL